MIGYRGCLVDERLILVILDSHFHVKVVPEYLDLVIDRANVQFLDTSVSECASECEEIVGEVIAAGLLALPR